MNYLLKQKNGFIPTPMHRCGDLPPAPERALGKSPNQNEHWTVKNAKRLMLVWCEGKQKREAFDAHLVRGFTMIELLVSISVFVIIIAITSGIFIASMRSNRTSVALISANSDAQLTLEQMARIVRKGLGTSFLAETFVGDGSTDLPQFKCLHFRYGNDFIVYRWNRNDRSLEWNVGSDNYASCGDSTGVFSGIISENLTVDFANFRVACNTGSAPNIDGTCFAGAGPSRYYPKITILLRVGTKNTQISSANIPFTNLQVSVSPRNDKRY